MPFGSLFKSKGYSKHQADNSVESGGCDGVPQCPNFYGGSQNSYEDVPDSKNNMNTMTMTSARNANNTSSTQEKDFRQTDRSSKLSPIFYGAQHSYDDDGPQHNYEDDGPQHNYEDDPQHRARHTTTRSSSRENFRRRKNGRSSERVPAVKVTKSRTTSKKLPGIFQLIEQRDWKRVSERAMKYPQECKVFGCMAKSNSSMRRAYRQQSSTCTESTATSTDSSGRLASTTSFASMDTSATATTALANNKSKAGVQVNAVECKALHHACQRLRSVHSDIDKLIGTYLDTHGDVPDNWISRGDLNNDQYSDPWIEACKAILTLVEVYPKAASQRESRHGCLPLHLAVFAMHDTPTLENRASSPRTQRISSNKHDQRMNSLHNKGQHSFNIHQDENPSPNMSKHPRRVSNSSHSQSCFSNESSEGLSDILEREGLGLGGSTTSRTDLEEAMELMEDKLSIGGDSEVVGTISPEETAQLVAAVRVLSTERPPPLASRKISDGSASSMGSRMSIMSSASTLMSTASALISPATSDVTESSSNNNNSNKEEDSATFDLQQYLANADIRKEYSVRVINALLDAYPLSVRVDSEGGRLPLHMAVSGIANVSVIQMLLRAFPDAARQRNNDGYLPLHLAAYGGVSDVSIAPALLRAYPDGMAGKNKWDRTPAEEAILAAGENGRPFQTAILQALGRSSAYWAGLVEHRDPNWREDVELLLMGEGNVSKSVNIDGVSAKSIDIISLMKASRWTKAMKHLQKKPEEAKAWLNTQCRSGFHSRITSLHLACERNPTYEIIEALVTICPKAVTNPKMPGGQLPLHAACTWGASQDVVGFLLAANQSTAQTKDFLGNVPLHSACYSGADERIIDSLLCIFPQAVGIRNRGGSKPIDIVKRLRHTNRKAVMNLLEKTYMELVKEKNNNEKTKKSSRAGRLSENKKLRKRVQKPKALGNNNTDAMADDDDGLLWV